MNQNVFTTDILKLLTLPFMVESVSAVDGSDVSGVIEEVGANSALCSDRHLCHGDLAFFEI